MHFQAKFADLNIGIDAKFPRMKEFCKGYLSDGCCSDRPQFSVTSSLEEIDAEDDKLSRQKFSKGYLETLAILRKISEKFPLYQRFLMHGAAISYEGKAYLFTALSGTGKSTHIRLWQQYLGEKVQVINGDKPFLWVKENEVLIYGSPWAGKEGWNTNCSAPLGGICFLRRGTRNRIIPISASECLNYLMHQVYVPSDPITAGLTLELLDQMLKMIPLYLLDCDMSEAAVRTSFEALTGLRYERTGEENEN